MVSVSASTLVGLVCASLILGITNAQSQWLQVGADIDGEYGFGGSGTSVSISALGNRVAIGTPSSASNVGSARVFELQSTTWIQIGGNIIGSNQFEYFGGAVSLSDGGTRLAVGSPGYGERNINGSVSVYELRDGSWTILGNVISGESLNDFFGGSVSISGDGTRLAVGATHNDGHGSESGHVRVFGYLGGSWIQLGEDVDGEAPNSFSGSSVSLSRGGGRLAIGANGNSVNGTLLSAGSVRVFEYQSGAWVKLGEDIDGSSAGEKSGTAVSLSDDGSRVAIGANRAVNENGAVSGVARVFELQDESWSQLGSDITGEASEDSFGISVSLSGDGTRLAVGGDRNDGSGLNAGHTRIFEMQMGVWTQLGSDIDGEAGGDKSGVSVSLSSTGTRVAIGAPENNEAVSGAGHTRIFELDIFPSAVPTAVPTAAPTLTMTPTTSVPTHFPSLTPTRSSYTQATMQGTIVVSGSSSNIDEITAVGLALEEGIGRGCEVETLAVADVLSHFLIQGAAHRRLSVSIGYSLSLVMEDNSDLTYRSFFATISSEIDALVTSGDLKSSVNTHLDYITGGAYTPMDVEGSTSDPRSVYFEVIEGDSSVIVRKFGRCSTKVYSKCLDNVADNNGDFSYCDMCICENYKSYGGSGNCMGDEELHNCFISKSSCKTKLKQAWIIGFACMGAFVLSLCAISFTFYCLSKKEVSNPSYQVNQEMSVKTTGEANDHPVVAGEHQLAKIEDRDERI